MTVFPQSNLNNEAVPWGRAIQGAVVSDSRRIGQLEEALVSENRASAGQMGSAGRQIEGLAEQTEELAGRLTSVSRLNTVSVTATSTTVWSSASVSGPVLGEGSSPRHALITVTAPVSKSGSAMSGPFVTVRFQGAVVFRRAVSGPGGLTPPGWGESLSTSFSATIPPGGATVQITAESQLFVEGSGTATLTLPEVTVFFVDKV